MSTADYTSILSVLATNNITAIFHINASEASATSANTNLLKKIYGTHTTMHWKTFAALRPHAL